MKPTFQGWILVVAVLSGCGTRTTAPSAPAPVSPRSGVTGSGVTLDESLLGRQIFPADNWWNLDVTTAPIDPNSQAIIDWISGRTPSNPTATRRLHPDFGPSPYGIPYVVVPGTQALRSVFFSPYGAQSDVGAPGRPPGYPIPDEAYQQPNYLEGGAAGGGASGDRHLLVIDRDHDLLFETWATSWNASAQRWEAGSGAAWDLATNGRRPEGWTSADAAGLAILPGLVRADEVYGPDEIHHAFRFTTRGTSGHVWPASHETTPLQGAPPMGTRLRMKASVDLSIYPPEMQKIFRAMKRYGLILADNGSDMYVTGTMDVVWNNDVLNPAFHSLNADDFEVVQLGWNPVSVGVP